MCRTDARLLVRTGPLQHLAIAIRMLALKNEFTEPVQQASDKEMLALTQM